MNREEGQNLWRGWESVCELVWGGVWGVWGGGGGYIPNILYYSPPSIKVSLMTGSQ